MTDVQLDELHASLSEHAFLFDDPRSYRSGVEDVLAAVRELLRAAGETRAG